SINLMPIAVDSSSGAVSYIITDSTSGTIPRYLDMGAVWALATDGARVWAGGHLGLACIEAATRRLLWMKPVDGNVYAMTLVKGVNALAAGAGHVHIGGAFEQLDSRICNWLGSAPEADVPTPVLVSCDEASVRDGHVKITWSAKTSSETGAVYRSVAGGSW